MSRMSQVQDLCNEAKQLLRQNDAAGAASRFQQALELHDTSVDAHEGLAAVYFFTGQHNLALEHYQRVTRLAPAKAAAYVNLGAVYNRIGEYQKAVSSLREAIQRDRRSSQAYYNLGIAHRGLHQLQLAISAYREAIRLQPDLADAFQNLANVYAEMNNYLQAITYYRRALEIRPGFERAQRGLERAERESAKQRAERNPFGPLVENAAGSASKTPADESLSPEPAGGTAPAKRELSPQERLEDRQELHRISAESAKAATALIDVLREQLEPGLNALDRAVAHGGNSLGLIQQSHEPFHKALKLSRELRESLRRKMLELRAHEELMNAPEIDLNR